MNYQFIKKKPSADVSLQITSMADVFTILLVFLLKSFSTDPGKLAPHSDIQLPNAEQLSPLIETLKLEISSHLIIIDDRPITELGQFNFDPVDLESDGTSRSLNSAFIIQKNKNTLRPYTRILILADEKTPFSTLKRILYSASNHGFEDFKLVAVGEN